MCSEPWPRQQRDSNEIWKKQAHEYSQDLWDATEEEDPRLEARPVWGRIPLQVMYKRRHRMDQIGECMVHVYAEDAEVEIVCQINEHCDGSSQIPEQVDTLGEATDVR